MLSKVILYISLLSCLYASSMFACQFCKHSNTTITEHYRNIRVHRTIKDFKVRCLYPECTAECTPYSSFKKHKVRFHRNVFEGDFVCKHDNCYDQFTSVSSLKKHYLWHAKQSGSAIVCAFCSKSAIFSTQNAYKIHISRIHRDFVSEDNVGGNIVEENIENSTLATTE